VVESRDDGSGWDDGGKMKFSTVEIRPYDGQWEATFYDLPHDRVEEISVAHALGFYHYPRKLGKAAAFEELRSVMLEAHEREIERLQKSAASLRELQNPATKSC
jgi:hypothetical protein